QCFRMGDKERFRDVFGESGFVADQERFDWEDAWQVGMKVTTAIRTEGPFKFTEGFVKNNIDSMSLKSDNRLCLRLPVEDTRTIRFFWCMQAILSNLGAECDFGRIFEE